MTSKKWVRSVNVRIEDKFYQLNPQNQKTAPQQTLPAGLKF